MKDNQLHNEKSLLQYVSEGDENAFKKLYHFYGEELRPLIWRYADSGIDMQEILQETFFKVWMNRDKLPEIENFRAWVFKIASREYLLMLRKKLNYNKRLDAYSVLSAENTPATPFEMAHLEDIKRTVNQAIDMLSPQRRTIYEMSRKQGLKIEEIASQLSISPQTVKNVLHTVLKLIRDHLVSAGFGPFLWLICFFTII